LWPFGHVFSAAVVDRGCCDCGGTGCGAILGACAGCGAILGACAGSDAGADVASSRCEIVCADAGVARDSGILTGDSFGSDRGCGTGGGGGPPGCADDGFPSFSETGFETGRVCGVVGARGSGGAFATLVPTASLRLAFSLNRIELLPQMITQSFSRLIPSGSRFSGGYVFRMPFFTMVISEMAASVAPWSENEPLRPRMMRR